MDLNHDLLKAEFDKLGPNEFCFVNMNKLNPQKTKSFDEDTSKTCYGYVMCQIKRKDVDKFIVKY